MSWRRRSGCALIGNGLRVSNDGLGVWRTEITEADKIAALEGHPVLPLGVYW